MLHECSVHPVPAVLLLWFISIALFSYTDPFCFYSNHKYQAISTLQILLVISGWWLRLSCEVICALWIAIKTTVHRECVYTRVFLKAPLLSSAAGLLFKVPRVEHCDSVITISDYVETFSKGRWCWYTNAFLLVGSCGIPKAF